MSSAHKRVRSGEWFFLPNHEIRVAVKSCTEQEPDTLPRAGLSDPPEVVEAYVAAAEAHKEWKRKRFRTLRVPAIARKRARLEDHLLFCDLSSVDLSKFDPQRKVLEREVTSRHKWIEIGGQGYERVAEACAAARDAIAAAMPTDPDVADMVACV